MRPIPHINPRNWKQILTGTKRPKIFYANNLHQYTHSEKELQKGDVEMN